MNNQHAMVQLLEDLHVHSTFSDGKNSVSENAAQADHLGLRTLGCVDHVRKTTEWVPEFVNEVHRVNSKVKVQLLCGLEAKLLNPQGELDMPENASLADFIQAADHRLPYGDTLLSPAEARSLLDHKELTERQIGDALMTAYEGVLGRHPNIVLAHPFSFLRQARIKEEVLSERRLFHFAKRAAKMNVAFEVSERWRCPQPRTIRTLRNGGMRMRLSTDSHMAASIGQYNWVLQQFRGHL